MKTNINFVDTVETNETAEMTREEDFDDSASNEQMNMQPSKSTASSEINLSSSDLNLSAPPPSLVQSVPNTIQCQNIHLQNYQKLPGKKNGPKEKENR